MKANIDLFKSAISHEVKSVAFYDKAAELTDNDESRMLFLELADMEYDHIGKLMQKATTIEFPEGFDPEAYCAEMEAAIPDSFAKEELAIIENGEMKEILQMVIRHEEKTQRNYHDLAEKACKMEEKKFCRELYDDEGYHIGSLRNLLLSLDMDDAERPAL